MTAAPDAERPERARWPASRHALDALDDGRRRARVGAARGRPRAGRAGPPRRSGRSRPTRSRPSRSSSRSIASRQAKYRKPTPWTMPRTVASTRAAVRRLGSGRVTPASRRRAGAARRGRARRGRAPGETLRGEERRRALEAAQRDGGRGLGAMPPRRAVHLLEEVRVVDRPRRRRTCARARSRATSIQIADDGLGGAPRCDAGGALTVASGSTTSAVVGRGVVAIRAARGRRLGVERGRRGGRGPTPTLGRRSGDRGRAASRQRRRPPRRGRRPASSRAGCDARIAARRAAGPASSRSRSVARELAADPEGLRRPRVGERQSGAPAGEPRQSRGERRVGDAVVGEDRLDVARRRPGRAGSARSASGSSAAAAPPRRRRGRS